MKIFASALSHSKIKWTWFDIRTNATIRSPIMVDKIATMFIATLKSSSSLNQILSSKWSVVTNQNPLIIDASILSVIKSRIALSARGFYKDRN